MAFGADDILIAGLVALAAGTAAQMYGQNKSSKAANAATQAALLQTRKNNEDIEKKVQNAAMQYEVPTTDKELADTSAQLNNRYQQPVAASQVVRADQSGTQGAVSDDYLKSKSAQDKASLASVRNLSELMSKINGASRMRMNQGFGLAKASNDIAQTNKWNRLADTENQLAIQAAGTKGQGWETAGGILQGLGAAATAYGAAGLAAAPAATGSLIPEGTELAAGYATPGVASLSANGTGIGLSAAAPHSMTGFGLNPALVSVNPGLVSAGSSSNFAPWISALGSVGTSAGGNRK